VEGFTCPEGKLQAFLWDSDAPGLALRATAKGAKAYVFQSRFMGDAVRITIGDLSVWPLNNRMDRAGNGGIVLQAGAREEARRLQSIIDSGRDPRLVKAEIKAADVATRDADKALTVTVGEAWGAYLIDRKPHWGDRHYQDHLDLAHSGGEKRKRSKEKTKAGPLARLMNERLSNLDSDRLEAWAAKEGATRPARARLALRLVRAFLNWCAERKEYAEATKPGAAKSKRIREKLGHAKARQLVLQKEQLSAWFAAVRALPNPIISAYLQYMLLTGPRPTEPLVLKWADVNFRWRTIKLRDKTAPDRERTIGMTPYVAQLFGSLPRRNEWVFSSPSSGSGHLTDVGNAHDAACLAAGLEKVTLQGLRRSFASLCEWIDVPGGISAQIQGHAPQGVREQKYIRRPVDLLRQWHEKIEAWILEQADIQVGPEVPVLRRIK
jgi:integrase